MENFTKPVNLNGTQLRKELRDAGIDISDNFDAVTLTGDVLSLDIDKKDANVASDIVAKHNGNTTPKEPTIQEKLSEIGLSVNDLKSALGL